MATLEYLSPRLRQLKPSGMRDAIVARAVEARARHFEPLEFLALLFDVEMVRREADGVARRGRQARFEEVCDLRDFDRGYNLAIPKERLWEFASGRYIAERSRHSDKVTARVCQSNENATWKCPVPQDQEVPPWG